MTIYETKQTGLKIHIGEKKDKTVLKMTVLKTVAPGINLFSCYS